MRQNGLLEPHRLGRTDAKPRDGTIITDKVNEMWGTDMTQTMTPGEGRAYVLVAVARQFGRSACYRAFSQSL